MAFPGIETFMIKDQVGFFELRNISWQNDYVALGLLFGKAKADQEVLGPFQEIFHTEGLDCVLKGFACVKLLESIKAIAENIPDRQRREEARLIREFLAVSSNLENILQSTGALFPAISQEYSKCLKFLIKKFCLHDDTIRLGIAAYKFKEIFQIETSMFHLTLDELEKIANSQRETSQEMLKILEKSFRIIVEKKLGAGNILSIITYNAFFRVLVSNQGTEQDSVFMEMILLQNITVFTVNQKNRLKEAYVQLCQKTRREVNQEVIRVLEAQFPSALVKNKEPQGSKLYYGNGSKTQDSFKQSIYKETNPHHRTSESRDGRFDSQTYEKNPQVFQDIKNQILGLIENTRILIQQGIEPNTEFLAETLKTFNERSHATVYAALLHCSYYEKTYGPRSVKLWKLFLEAVNMVGIFNFHEFDQFREYFEYIEFKSRDSPFYS